MEITKTQPGLSSVVPTFLLKLLNLLQEPEYKDYVSWNEDGTAFTVHDQGNFAKHVLPVYFKHNKFASFVRQLNMYGFRKVTTVMHGGIASLHDTAIQFHHPFFIRGEESLLPYIKRKVNQTGGKLIGEEISQVLDNVQDIKETQNGISNTLSELKRENEDLWREVVSLRQKHSHQQKVVNRLIQFLVSLVQHHGMGMKRRMPLMIDDASESSQRNKMARTEEVSRIDSNTTALTGNPDITFRANDSPTVQDGPLITELLTQKSEPTELDTGNTLDNEDDFDISELIQIHSPKSTDKSSSTTLNSSKDSPASYFTDIPTNERSGVSYLMGASNEPTISNKKSSNQVSKLSNSKKEVNNQQVAIPSKFVSPNKASDTDYLNSNMDIIQTNLKDIQRRLSNNEQIELDYDIIQELFNNSVDITPNPGNMFDPAPVSLNLPQDDTSGALVQYNSIDKSTDNDPEQIQFSSENLGDILDMLKE
uniref:HSF-type DNA-binding domain-containing protein n=1 Tax=Ciona savignyi TaxID=51511 RepID=H2ZEC6_CIOSA